MLNFLPPADLQIGVGATPSRFHICYCTIYSAPFENKGQFASELLYPVVLWSISGHVKLALSGIGRVRIPCDISM